MLEIARATSESTVEESGRNRVCVSDVMPHVDAGRFPVKRVAGEPVVVTAVAVTDGHDRVAAAVRHRRVGGEWAEVAMEPLGNDRWTATFHPETVGRHEFVVDAWIDRFATWRADLAKKTTEVDVHVDLLAGAELVRLAGTRAGDTHLAGRLDEVATLLADEAVPVDGRVTAALDDATALLVAAHEQRRFTTTTDPVPLEVDRPRARFSTWYELFPRSTADEPGRHGTLADVVGWLDHVADLGFDVLYLPPIHPIGTTHRKGPNNTTTPGPDDVGSPWAIGAAAGGHKAVHPDLGTLQDVDMLVAAARERDIEVALDIAFQCSPDHPYVTAHPEWFRHRADGSIQYAENPPKRYQDIYPFDFESDEYASLWDELKSVFDFWIDRGIRIFRVDNPHTKALPFWEWCLNAIKDEHPDVIFLAEAFTRPALMHGLAKRGFSQSYTYFTWRTRRHEIEEYFSELTTAPVVDFFRPNAWPNTPDILPEILQYGGRPAFVQRLVLAATLCANYGIYGPAFELQDHEPVEPGAEEYRDSEKYQLRHWDLDAPHSLAPLIRRVNRIRHDNPALQRDRGLCFHGCDNQELVCYSKASEDGRNVVLTVVNLDPHHTQSGWVHLDLEALGLDPQESFQVHDLLGDSRYLWQGAHNFVELDPHVLGAHVFVVRRRDRSERDFDYFA